MSSDHFEDPVYFRSGATLNQMGEIVDLFDEAFAAKFRAAIVDTNLRKKFWSQILNHQQLIVAERSREILGMAVISFPDRPGFSKDAASKLFQVLGRVKGFRASFIFMLFSKLDWKPEQGTCYLEALSVSSKARGLGLGTRMLEHISVIAKSEGMDRLTLKVTLENPEANRLYLRRGFEVTATSRHQMLRLFTGTHGADTMTLRLDES
jgi:ribosomal protein S18 acetylase RimI-like enzyme